MRKVLLLMLSLGFVSMLSAQVICYVETPPSLEGNKEMTWADPGGGWGCPDLNIPANAVLDTCVFAYDASPTADSLCCGAVVNGTQVNGKIAVLYRGSCEFGVKALNAQNAGAVAVIIINNIPGAPVGMGAGAQGVNVTIPVIMISQADGAALRNEILAGNVTAFIGSKNGFYPNDVGFWPKDYLLAPATSNPKKANGTASEYQVQIGSWVFNYGQNVQYNVTLNANISYMGGTVYNNTSTPVTINPGDSLWVALPTFSQATYNSGLYKFKYTVDSDSADDFTADNERRADFTISDTLFSFAAIDTTTLMPITNAAYRPTGATEMEMCLHYRDSLSGRLATSGMWFSAATGSADSLDGIYIETILYEWNNVFVDLNDAGLAFDNLNPVVYGGYTYASDLQNQMVWAPWTSPYSLDSNQRYLFCVKTFDATVFLGFGTTTDYDEHLNTYLQPVAPISSDGTWYAAGFGTDVTPSIGVRMFDVLTLGDEPVTGLTNGKPAYPNPASNLVNIPLADIIGDVEITIMDMNGKVIKTEVRNISSPGILPINIEGVSNGQYIIRVATPAGQAQTFKILINN